jgi:hypothetical protein
MSVFIRVADFLPKNTQLMAFVKPSEDVNEELYKETIKKLKTKPLSRWAGENQNV